MGIKLIGQQTPAEEIAGLSCDDILIKIEYTKNVLDMLENEYRKRCITTYKPYKHKPYEFK